MVSAQFAPFAAMGAAFSAAPEADIFLSRVFGDLLDQPCPLAIRLCRLHVEMVVEGA